VDLENWGVGGLPDDVVIVAELPHTATGKVLKSKLRDRHGLGARDNEDAD
jgi:acyl-CoA synthetase (AMP-forming)/AMP-acid ligase II